jgi:8-oxo-dGTP diphosphatase
MNNWNIPPCFYRISAKALVLNETRDKFLVCLEENGHWALPGGGLEWGESPQMSIPREISEEMGLEVTFIAAFPTYFVTYQTRDKSAWMANLLYETELRDLTFTPSYECNDIRFVHKDDLEGLRVFNTVRELAEQFNPERHRR